MRDGDVQTLGTIFAIVAFFQNSYSQLPGRLSPDYKYLHARQIPHQLSFSSQTIPNYIRYMLVSLRNFC